MAFRHIIIESAARISVRNQQLVICTDAEHSVSIEDLSVLMLENRQTTITAAALSRLGQGGCAVFVCDEKHLPCAVLTPCCQHSRELTVIRKQLEASEPLKKRLWQSVVIAKIRNQALCLKLSGKTEQAEALFSMAGRVRSGDTGNVEAVAAQFYFPALFGDGFSRGDENGYNAGLNYGYAVLRGCMARTLAVYGFLPALGLHHHSTLNSFNLADDLMEPFRPVADLLVVRKFQEDDELIPEKKHLLFNCMTLDTLSGGQRHSVSYAADRLVQSLIRSLGDGKPALTLPELVDLRQHQYE